MPNLMQGLFSALIAAAVTVAFVFVVRELDQRAHAEDARQQAARQDAKLLLSQLSEILETVPPSGVIPAEYADQIRAQFAYWEEQVQIKMMAHLHGRLTDLSRVDEDIVQRLRETGERVDGPAVVRVLAVMRIMTEWLDQRR
jgi:hypothetical protein